MSKMQRSLANFGFKPKSQPTPSTGKAEEITIAGSIFGQIFTDILTETVKNNLSEISNFSKSASSVKSRWFSLFPWLETNEQQNLMFCKICRECKMKTDFATTGAANCQMSTLRKHNDSKIHNKAVAAIDKRTSRQSLLISGVNPSCDSDNCSSDDSETEADNQDETPTIKLFRTVYCLAKANVPSNQINFFLEMQRLNGLDIPFKDLHSSSISQIHDSIVYVIDNLLKADLKQINFYGIIVDESCDISIQKKLGMYIRYVDPVSDEGRGLPVTKFVGNVRVPDGKAETITREVENKVQELGLNLDKMVSLGSDGASVMMGRKSGVGVRLKEKSPSLVHVHCLAHRVSLASTDAAKDFQYLQELKSTVLCLYNYFTNSAVRYSKLHELQEVFGEPSLQLKEPINIRWLSLNNALSTIRQSYQSIIGCLSDDGERKNDTTAKGLVKNFTSYKFVAVLHFLCDILAELTALSLKLQKEDVYFATVVYVVETAMGKLEALKLVSGDNFREFEEMCEVSEDGKECTFKNVSLSGYMYRESVIKQLHKYVDAVQEKLKNRLEASDSTRDILDGLCALLDPSLAKDLKVCEVKEHVRNLEDHYGQGEVSVIQKGFLLKEWPCLKKLLTGTYKNKTAQEVCKYVMTKHIADFPVFSRLCEAAMCIAVTSVACERGFSYQNKIKTKGRSSLSAESMDKLLKIMLGPEPQDFPIAVSVRHWNRQKARRLRALQRPKKKLRLC